MTPTPPLLYLAFANHQAHPLENLVAESREVYQILHPRAQKGNYLLHREEFAELDTIAYYLAAFKDQVMIFHFGGHASSDALLLRDLEARSAGIAGMLRQQKNLALVFLNGCSTGGQVDFLLELGIPCVIATSAPVNDELATLFAIQFYQSLALGYAIEASFDNANYVQARKSIGISRVLGKRSDAGLIDDMHWGLFAKDEPALQWTLPAQPFALRPDLEPAKLAEEILKALLGHDRSTSATGPGKYFWELIQKSFTGETDKNKLDAFLRNPNDAKAQGKLEGKLEELFEQDSGFALLAATLLLQLQQQPGTSNTQIITGNDNISIQGISETQITIHKK